MNAKLCKKLRREAERLTAGNPPYLLQPIKTHLKWYLYATSNIRKPYQVINSIRIHPRCTHGVYRALKKQVRQLKLQQS